MARLPTYSDKAPRPIRGFRQYEGLKRPQRRALDGAREVIGYSRENKVHVSQAIKELRDKGVHTSMGSVRRYFGNAVEKDWRGRLVATRSDPNLRVMTPLTTNGQRAVYVRGSKGASIVAQHESAVRAYLNGDPSKLAEWRERYGDKTFRGVDGRTQVLETDGPEIEDRDERGEVSYEDLYPEVA